MHTIQYFISFVWIWCIRIVPASYTNFQVKSCKLCNNTQGLFKVYVNITKEHEKHYVTAKYLFPIPLDEHIGITMKIESLVLESYMELFTIREKNLCKALNIYGGELWYDVQRGAQIIPKTCPLPAGRYELHHVELDFNKLALQTFPFGFLRFTGNGVDNKHPERKLFCIVTEVENIPN